MKKALSALLAVFLMLHGLVPAFAAANQQSPSKGDTLAPRMMPSDGVGRIYAEDHFMGYKVFEDSNSSTGVLITDENSNKPACGSIHMVCVGARQDGSGAGIEYAQVTETPVVFSGRQSGNLAPPIALSATLGTQYVCQAVDAQFNNFVEVWNSGTDLDTLVYWMACAGNNPR